MLNKLNTEEALRRVEAFWNLVPTERPALLVRAKSQDGGAGTTPASAAEPRTLDIEEAISRAESQMAQYVYPAEAFPSFNPGLMCSDMAAFFYPHMGVDIAVKDNTVWYPPLVEDWDSFTFSFDKENPWWQLVRDMTAEAARRGKDRFLVGIPDFQAGMDIISLLRSPSKLCLDLMVNPAVVKEAARFVLDEVYRFCVDEIMERIREHSSTYSNWLGIAAWGRTDIIQCDFCALIGPKHFEEFCLPDIQRQAEMLDNSIFHLDGPDAIRHMQAILQVKQLDAIQWVPGAGAPPVREWLAMLKGIQKAGKGVWIAVPAADVKPIVSELSPTGLMIAVCDPFNTRDDAEQFIGEVAKRCRK